MRRRSKRRWMNSHEISAGRERPAGRDLEASPSTRRGCPWLDGKSVVVCPLGELGFLRISSNTKAINAPMSEARVLLDQFLRERNVEWIADDLRALEATARKSSDVTDFYLAELA